MSISSDVNVIFAFVNELDSFHIPVFLFLAPYKRKDIYVLLDNVKVSFIYTYSNYLKDACVLIEKSIIDLKNDRVNIKRKLSPFAINAIVNQKIKEKLKELSNKDNSNIDAIKRFINRMLSEYSIISLFENNDKLAEFREKYLIESEKESDVEITRFLSKFKKFEIVNQYDLKKNKEWLNRIKASELDIFENKNDYEDMKIASEFLAYNDEKGRLSFMTCDREFYRSLGILTNNENLKIGKLKLIRLNNRSNR